MQPLDYAVLAFYLLGTVAVGLAFAKKNKSSDDMFSAGGESPWWASGLSAYMTMFSAGTFVVWGGIAYSQGAVAIAINLCYGIAAFFVGYFIAARWKTLGVGTPAEFIDRRFGARVVMFYTWTMMIFRVVGTAVALYALSVILVSLMPLDASHPLQDPLTGNLSVTWAILIFGVIVVAYTMIGGLWAVLMTDVLQFIILTLAVALILPLMWAEVGDLAYFLNATPDGFLSPISKDYSLLFLGGWVLVHIFAIGAEWAFTQRFISVPTPRDAQKSAYLFGVLYVTTPFLWMLPPMLYRVIEPGVEAEQAYMLASSSVLPVGMIGLMVAAMFSATASLVSSQLNVFAGVLTENLYQKYFAPNATDKQSVIVGRLFTVLLGTVLIGIAIAVPYMGGAERIIVSITSLLVGPLMAPTLFGLFNRKMNSQAVWITIGVCALAGIISKLGLANEGILTSLPILRELGHWIDNNPRNLDIILGVGFPLATLLIIQPMLKHEDQGARNVDAVPKAPSGTPPKQASRLPSLVVAIALSCCSILFYGVALLADAQQHILIIFATLVGAIALAIFYARRKLAIETAVSPSNKRLANETQ